MINHQFVDILTKNYDDEFQIAIVVGNNGKKIDRALMEDMINADNLIYDNESNNIIKRPSKISVIKGKVKNTLYWNNENISSADITRLKKLNENDKINNGDFTESTIEESIANKKYVITYKFGADYDSIAPNSLRYILTTSHLLESLEDDTRLFCFLTNKDGYEIDVLDVPIAETKTISKNYNTNINKYLYFSQNCLVNENEINQYECKKFTSDSVVVENKSEEILRIFLISR